MTLFSHQAMPLICPQSLLK